MGSSLRQDRFLEGIEAVRNQLFETIRRARSEGLAPNGRARAG